MTQRNDVLQVTLLFCFVLFFNLFILYLFIYAAPGLSCGMRDLCCGMQDILVAACRFLSCGMWTSQLWHVDFLIAACGLLVEACMQDLVPRPGIEPGPPCPGSTESQALNHQGSPSSDFKTRYFVYMQSVLYILRAKRTSEKFHHAFRTLILVVIFLLLFRKCYKFIVGICCIGCRMKQTEQILFIHRIFICDFIYSLTYICNLRIKTVLLWSFDDKCRVAENLSSQIHVPNWGQTRRCSPFFQLSYCKQGSFLQPVTSICSQFCAFCW